MSAAEPVLPERLREPELYLNRELSQLAFNWRVLEQAKDPATPLLERLKFLCIASTNLDEFFEIRVARLQEQVASSSVHAGPDNMGAQELLRQIATEAHRLVDEQYRVWNEELIPALDREQVRFVRRGDWTPAQVDWVRHHFERELLPCCPMGLDRRTHFHAS
jgi:polyphosphate kinase